MKIEIKNTDFKYLVEFIEGKHSVDLEINRIYKDVLLPQYNKYFLKYKGEKQKFIVGEKILFTWPRSKEWCDGEIYKVFRRADGKYMYIVKYQDDDVADFDVYEEIDDSIRYTNRLTDKNIKKK